MRVQWAQASDYNPPRARIPGNLNGELNVASYADWTYIYRVKYRCWREYMAQCAYEYVKNDYGRFSDVTPNVDPTVNRTVILDKTIAANYEPKNVAGTFYCDCSSLAYMCFALAARKFRGLNWNGYVNQNTSAIDNIVAETYMFEFSETPDVHRIYDESVVQRGDILWREGHMAIALNGTENVDGYDVNWGGSTVKGNFQTNEDICRHYFPYIVDTPDDPQSIISKFFYRVRPEILTNTNQFKPA